MSRWAEIQAAEPELAAEAQRFFEIAHHKALATIRADGSPRVSGTEARFIDGDLWFGSMWMTPKARDLRRDPRFALHSPSAEPDVWIGDAKVAGTVEEVDDQAAKDRLLEVAGTQPPAPFHLFRADITELVVIRLGEPADHLVVRRWTPGGGVSTRRLD